MFRSLFLILSGNFTSAVIVTARNLVIARLLSLGDYGIASTFMLAMALVEMLSQLGLQQQIVQAKNGNDTHLQAALQGFQALRGCLNGLALFLLGAPIASFFGHPELAWAYQAVATIPVMNGFGHFDIHRHGRQMRHLPAALSTVLPALASLLLVWPFFLIFGDYRVMLFVLLVQAATALIVSHLIAERPYQLVLDREIIVGSLRFGWPIMVDGLLLFLIFNGERMIVGRELGMEVLALFTMAFSLALLPTLVLSKSMMSFFLPQISVEQEEGLFRRVAITSLEAHFVLGAAVTLGITFLGGLFIHLTLGERYWSAIPLLSWLGILQGIRLMRAGFPILALARAHTSDILVANLLRVALLPIAWWVAATQGDLQIVVLIGIAGEVAGLAVAFTLAIKRYGLAPHALGLPLGATLVFMSTAAIHAMYQTEGDLLPNPFIGGILVALFGISLLTMRDLIRYVRHRQIKFHKD